MINQFFGLIKNLLHKLCHFGRFHFRGHLLKGKILYVNGFPEGRITDYDETKRTITYKSFDTKEKKAISLLRKKG